MKSASQAYCTSAAKGLMLFMQHSPYSAVSCCSLMRCTTKHKSPSESLIEHSQQHEKLYARTLMSCNTLKCSSDSVRTGRRKKRKYVSGKQLNPSDKRWHLETIARLGIWVFRWYFFVVSPGGTYGKVMCIIERKWCTHTRTHTCTLSWGETVGVFVVLSSCLCTICLLKPPVCP